MNPNFSLITQHISNNYCMFKLLPLLTEEWDLLVNNIAIVDRWVKS